jgi:hypothetical protein
MSDLVPLETEHLEKQNLDPLNDTSSFSGEILLAAVVAAFCLSALALTVYMTSA